MLPVNFPGANITLSNPNEVNDPNVLDNIPALYMRDTYTGMPCFIMAWQPSKEDIDAINSGQPIWVKILAAMMPQYGLLTMGPDGQPNTNL